MAEVTVRIAEVQLRTCKLTKALLKQARQLQHLDKGLRDESGTDVNEKCIGWVHGAALGLDEWTRYLVFTHNGDLFLFGWAGYKGKAKQLYV